MDGAGADFLQLRGAEAPARGLAQWLTGRIRDAIADGRLASGVPLPPTRTLATELAVSRGVVVEAYRRLTDEGLVVARTGAGTVVAEFVPSAPVRVVRPPRRPATLPVRAGPGIEFDLSPGVPDLAAFPRAAWLRAERTALDSIGATDLGYGDPRGHPVLRRELSGWLTRHRGVRADPDEILIVAGVAQAFALLAQVLQARGVDAVAVEDPGSRGARDQLVHWGMRPVPIAVDDDGLIVDELARSGATVAMLTPAHQFPTGVVLGPARRRELLAWAVGDRLVIEDDYDAEHRYDRAPVPAVQPSAPDAVAYAGSVSKTLAPGVRLGWLIAPDHLRDDLLAAKHATDIVGPALPQLALAGLIADGGLERHLRAVRTRQRTRRNALLEALRTHLPDAMVHGVAAGLHLLITFPDRALDDVVLAERIGADGVLVHPLSWHRQRSGEPGLVLGYATQSPGRLADAALLIARALDDVSGGGRAGSRSAGARAARGSRRGSPAPPSSAPPG